MTKWKSMPAKWPTDGQTVWIRSYWLWKVFAGTWSAAAGAFVDVKQWDPHVGWLTSTQSVPWWTVTRWRVIDQEPVVL
jgi:hypothetical protein